MLCAAVSEAEKIAAVLGIRGHEPLGKGFAWDLDGIKKSFVQVENEGKLAVFKEVCKNILVLVARRVGRHAETINRAVPAAAAHESAALCAETAKDDGMGTRALLAHLRTVRAGSKIERRSAGPLPRCEWRCAQKTITDLENMRKDKCNSALLVILRIHREIHESSFYMVESYRPIAIANISRHPAGNFYVS